MRIKVKFFAIARDRAGTAEIELQLAERATVSVAEGQLKSQFPQLAEVLPRTAFAVNQSYAGRDTTLSDGDELAVIPPVSGG